MNYVDVSALAFRLGGNAIVNKPVGRENIRIEAADQDNRAPTFSTSSRMLPVPRSSVCSTDG
jgi:hypothetical protein